MTSVVERGGSKTVRTGRPTAEEQLELVRRYQDEGDTRARELLFEAHADLIHRIVHDTTKRYAAYRNRPWKPDEEYGMVNVEDLDQEGYCAFLVALEKFDPGRGSAFYSYVWSVVGRHLAEVLKRSRYVSGGDAARRDVARLIEVRQALRRTLGCEPSAKRVAGELGITERRYRTLDLAARTGADPLSLAGLDCGEDHDPVPPEHRSPEAGPEDELLDAEYRQEHDRLVARLGEALDGAALSDRERTIARDLYGLGGRPKLAATAVARKHGVCRSRLYQLKAGIEQKLRAALLGEPDAPDQRAAA